MTTLLNKHQKQIKWTEAGFEHYEFIHTILIELYDHLVASVKNIISIIDKLNLPLIEAT